MARMPLVVSVTLGGDVIAHEVMRAVLREIAEGGEPWQEATIMAREALEAGALLEREHDAEGGNG